MRIGLTGGAATTGRLVEQACRAEEEGFTSLWYASSVLGDPLTAMAIAGLATSRIELGTAVLQTYPCHPVLQARRVAAAAEAMERPGLTLGIGPSHRSLVTDVYGLFYDHPGRNTEEYLRILTAVLRTGAADVEGVDWRAHTGEPAEPPEHHVPVLLSAMSPRLLRAAAELADGVVTWMAPARVLETRIAPALTAAGRPTPRIVAGLPVAVHDDIAEARASAAAHATAYADQPNYQRILAAAGLGSPADAAIVGDERSVQTQLRALIDAGATDIWAAVFPVGPDRRASVRRTRDLLRGLIG